MLCFELKTIKYGTKAICTLVLSLLVFFNAASQNLIVNGDLNGNTSTWSTGYPSWTCNSTDCIANGAGHPFFSFAGVGDCPYADAQDCDGSYGWFANGEYLYQSVSTTIGQTYVIEFYYSNLSLYDETCTAISTIWGRSWDNDASIQVKVDGTLIATTPPASPSPLPGGNTWSYFSTTFTATSSSHSIRFDGILNTFNPPAPYFGLGIDLIGVRLPNDEGSTYGSAFDGIDNDGDGLIDCADPGCAAFCGANNLCGIILPVGLLEFETQCNNRTINLRWATASETNNDYFTIERSMDGVTFEEVARINGVGNSSQVKKYAWIDKSPLTDIAYYRLSQTDFDGKTNYMGVRNSTCAEVSGMLIYPNPFENDFTITLGTNVTWPIQISVYDNLGREVYHESVKNEVDKINVNFGYQIPVGQYLVKVLSDNEQFVEKLVKLK